MYYYKIVTPFVPDKTYTYCFSESLPIGTFVAIPFGGRRLRAVITELENAPSEDIKYKTLEPLEGIDPISKNFIELIKKVSAYYFIPEGILFKLAMPPDFLKSINFRYKLNKKQLPLFLNNDELQIIAAISSDSKTLSSLQSLLKGINVNYYLNKLIKNGLLTKEFDNSNTIIQSPKKKAVALLNCPDEETLVKLKNKAPAQAKVIHYLLENKHNDFFICSELADTLNVGYTVFNELAKKGFVTVFYDYKALVNGDRYFGDRLTLNKNQQEFVDKFKKHHSGINLLHGVTGSGKSECYLRCADHIMEQGKNVLYLVPEIGLTPSTISRLKVRFGNDIAIQHSSLSKGERLSEWIRILNGKVRIVVGTRSSAFAPLKNIGLIVVDEEHDSSFKQESFPKYNALHTVLIRSRIEKCSVILGSATPSIESFYNSKVDKYSFFTLPERVNNIQMPEIVLTDMKEEFKQNKGKKQIISKLLESEINATLNKDKQVLLFLNRRGYAPYLLCRRCGFTETCENCSVSLTVHSSSEGLPLKCHYCGESREIPSVCSNCGDNMIQMIGFGTQQIEKKVKKLFPNASVFRADKDTMQRKSAFRELTDKMLKKEIDILIGTQMIAKGHHFPHLQLTGVIDADSGLKFPDFRSSEKTFSLLIQVAGRAGREGEKGKVILQTYLPDHPVFEFVKKGDYQNFAVKELNFREKAGYPPFSHMISIEIKGKDEDEVNSIASSLKAKLDIKNYAQLVVLGPLKAGIYKLKDNFRMQIILRSNSRTLLRNAFKQCIYGEYNQSLKNPNIKIIPDIDPYFI